MDVFDTFQVTPYTFLQLKQGSVTGNTIVSQTAATGILKLRDGMAANFEQETVTSDATLHIRPSEAFVGTLGNLVGHGIRSSKVGKQQDYRIIGQVEGYNFHTNELEFIKVTLKREAIA